MLSCDFRKLLAAGLLLTTTLVTMPVSAADFSSARPVIGSVSAVGSVELRGVGISQEGTLFAGDSIRANDKGYAKVLLGTGSKIEVYEKTAVSVSRDAKGMKIAMSSGVIGITAKTPIRVDVMPYEVTASDDAAAHVGYLSPTTASVKALNGKVTVRNTKTSESFVVLKGHEQLLGLNNGIHAPSLGEVAGNVPTVPTLPTKPQTPAGKTGGGGLAMDTGAWLAVLGGGALAAISIWALVEAHNNNDDINSLNGTIKNLNSTIAANQQANAAALAALQTCLAVSANLENQLAAINQVTTQATAALQVLVAAGQQNTAAAQQLTATLNSAAAAQAAIGPLTIQAGSCAANPTAFNTSGLVTSTNAQVSNTNTVVGQFNNALTTAKAQNPNVTGSAVSTVPGVQTGSPSSPH
jgi:hypothetical protein